MRLIVLSVLLVTLLTSGCDRSGEGANRTPLTTVAVAIDGMVCESCVNAITAAVDGVEGVSGCSVSLESGRAEIRVEDPAAADQAVAAIRQLNFEVVVVDEAGS